METSIWSDLKRNVLHSDNIINKLIAANIIAFLGLSIPLVILQLFNIQIHSFIQEWLYLPNHISDFITRPWTLISYMFLHSFSDIFHIIMNMLVLYWFGSIFREYLGNRKALALYFLGGIAGGILYMSTAFFPLFAGANMYLVGASASVLALLVGAATLLPDYSIRLILIGNVKLKWLALFMVILDLISITGSNAGGSLAHLGGAAMGFIYVKQIQQGNDIGEWLSKVFDAISQLFKAKPKQSNFTVHRNPTQKKRNSNSAFKYATQAEIDAILEKVKVSGYEALSKSEKEILFKESNK